MTDASFTWDIALRRARELDAKIEEQAAEIQRLRGLLDDVTRASACPTFREAVDVFYDRVWLPAHPDVYPPVGSTVDINVGYFREDWKTEDGVVERYYLDERMTECATILTGETRYMNARRDPGLGSGRWCAKPAEGGRTR